MFCIVQYGIPSQTEAICCCPFFSRRFLAILSLASQKCSSFLFLESQKFLLCGGDPRWLELGLCFPPSLDSQRLKEESGGNGAPLLLSPRTDKLSKFRAMAEFNQILLHRPWALEASHVAALVKPPPDLSSAIVWTIPEVVHGIAILAHFHAVACICHGCGVAPEMDDVFLRQRRRRGASWVDEGRCGASLASGALQEEDEEEVDHVSEVIDKMKSIEMLTGPEMDADQKARVFLKIAEEEPQIVIDAEALQLSVNSEGDGKTNAADSAIIREESMPSTFASLNLEVASDDSLVVEDSSSGSTSTLMASPKNDSKRKNEVTVSSPPQHFLCIPERPNLQDEGETTLITTTKTTTENQLTKFLHGAHLRFIDFSSSRNRQKGVTSCSSPASTPPSSPTKKTPPSKANKKAPKSSQKYEPLRLDEFSWQDHGYSIMSRFKKEENGREIVLRDGKTQSKITWKLSFSIHIDQPINLQH